MKYIVFFISLLTASCTTVPVADQEFIADLGSVNSRISGELYLDHFEGNLRPLTYRHYVSYLKDREMFSGKGTAEKLTRADSYCFLSDSSSFAISLYFRSDNLLISDNSATSFTDTVIGVDGRPGISTMLELTRRIMAKPEELTPEP